MKTSVLCTFCLIVLTVNYVTAFCRRDEVYKICPGCPATCQHSEPYVCFLPCVAKCVCRPGLLREEKTRKCVTPENCSNRPKTTTVTTTTVTMTPAATTVVGVTETTNSTVTTTSTTTRRPAASPKIDVVSQ